MRFRQVLAVLLCVGLLAAAAVHAEDGRALVAQPGQETTAVPATPDLSLDGKACAQGSECGGFPCVDGKCLVKACDEDSDCPNNLCGLHATPTPGYCTNMDVK